MDSNFTVAVPHSFRTGWGAWFTPIYDDDDSVAEIDSGVAQISTETVTVVGGAPSVAVAPNLYVPVQNFLVDPAELTADDTHDMRCRWFATELEAAEHVMRTMRDYANPNPWERFVTFD